MTWTPSTQQAVKEVLLLFMKWIAVERTDENNGDQVNAYLDEMLGNGRKALEFIRQEEEKMTLPIICNCPDTYRAMQQHVNSCPVVTCHAITGDDGTSYCPLAEEIVRRKDAEIAELKEVLENISHNTTDSWAGTVADEILASQKGVIAIPAQKMPVSLEACTMDSDPCGRVLSDNPEMEKKATTEAATTSLPYLIEGLRNVAYEINHNKSHAAWAYINAAINLLQNMLDTEAADQTN